MIINRGQLPHNIMPHSTNKIFSRCMIIEKSKHRGCTCIVDVIIPINIVCVPFDLHYTYKLCDYCFIINIHINKTCA